MNGMSAHLAEGAEEDIRLRGGNTNAGVLHLEPNLSGATLGVRTGALQRLVPMALLSKGAAEPSAVVSRRDGPSVGTHDTGP